MKLSLNFLDRWENGIFKKYDENHEPVSSFVATTVLCSSFATVLTIFIMKLFGSEEATRNVVSEIIIGCSFLLTVWKSYWPVVSFPTIGAKVGFGAYILLIFGISTGLFVTLASIVLIVFLGFLALWLVSLLLGGSDSSSGKKYTARYSDGSSEELDEDGSGPTGEKFYKGKDTGNQFVEP